MPCLPGTTAPLAIQPSSKKRAGKGGGGGGASRRQGRGKGKGGAGAAAITAGDPKDESTIPQPLPKGVAKRDDELFQIDLQRKQVLLKNQVESYLDRTLRDFAIFLF